MSSQFSQSLPWLQPGWLQLTHYLNQNRIPQALLIAGNKGLGKKHLAHYFSQSLLCEIPQPNGEYCGNCQSCILFDARTHPDYLYIEPEETGKTIGISVIRQLTEKLALKPQFERYRTVIINPADRLNHASANAFLKYLEEPTERTCLILITDKPSRLPATLLSRCQQLTVSVPNVSTLEVWWKNQGLLDENKILLNLAQGAPLLAKKMADSDTLKLREECFKYWSNFTHSEVNFVILAEQWSKTYNEKSDLLLFWVLGWISDMIKLSYDEQAINLYNPDLITDLQEMVVKLDLKSLYRYYDFLLISRQKLDSSVNKQLLIEEILIRWSKLNGR